MDGHAATIPPEAHWRTALGEGRFLLQREATTGRCFFPPRLAGPGAEPLEWIEAEGRGTVHAVTVIHPRPPREPYNVVLIDLAEGPRMMSRIEGVAADEITIGMPVRAAIATDGDGPLVVFHPA